MADKLDTTKLKAGQTLYGRYKGVTYTAEVVPEVVDGKKTDRLGFKLADGGIRYSLERAGKDASGAAHLDGRSFWSFDPPADKPAPTPPAASGLPKPRRMNPDQKRMVEEMAAGRVEPSGTDEYECTECHAVFAAAKDCLDHLDAGHDAPPLVDGTGLPEPLNDLELAAARELEGAAV